MQPEQCSVEEIQLSCPKISMSGYSRLPGKLMEQLPD
jgi:hypothetical protein